jgi:hypothetical protein
MLSSQSQVSASTKIGSNSAILDKKIDETAEGLQSATAKRLHSINETNAAIIVDYVASLQCQIVALQTSPIVNSATPAGWF